MLFEVHQVEGFDYDKRMFSRDIKIDVDESGYTGRFLYEGLTIQSHAHPTVEEVIKDISKRLHKKDFSDLRTRLNFREDRYLAEREPWVDYPN